MSRLTRDGTAEPVSRDQILRRERGQGNTHFPCSADHEQDIHTHIHTYGSRYIGVNRSINLRPYFPALLLIHWAWTISEAQSQGPVRLLCGRVIKSCSRFDGGHCMCWKIHVQHYYRESIRDTKYREYSCTGNEPNRAPATTCEAGRALRLRRNKEQWHREPSGKKSKHIMLCVLCVCFLPIHSGH